MNTIFLRRQNKVMLQKEAHALPKNYIATLLKNIQGLGYTLSPEVLDVISTFSETSIADFYNRLTTDLKEMVGANVVFNPMYPNFPKQVMEMDKVELHINALAHYFGDWFEVRILPQYEKEDRSPLNEALSLKVIELGTEDEFQLMIKNLIGANTSISSTDQEDIKSAIDFFQNNVEAILPERIPSKENLAFVTKHLLDLTEGAEDRIAKLFKTATDVLRLAVSMSDGDVSLATNTKFKKFSRPQRRLILSALDNCNRPIEDMLRYKKQWIRLGEIIHPGEYKNRYTNAFLAFDVIRNDKPFETFNSKVEQLFQSGDFGASALFLSKRPGELARRLDFLLRNVTNHQVVNSQFESIADQVSTPVLMQVMKHFKHRNEANDLRVIFPKGNVGKAIAIENKLPILSLDVAQTVVQICETTLINRFKTQSDLGKVYLDENLQNYFVPFSQRSASKSLRTIVRGSRVAMPEGGDTIRFFLWWTEGMTNEKSTGRVDIDLSAVMYDDNWKYKEHISYTNLKSDKYQAAHSGDITSAPNGACEFIDIDIPSVLKYGGRYVVMNVYSYTRQSFNTLPACFGGWMIRQSPQSGEIFEPKTVVDKLDLTADTKICIPVILDLQERQMIWTDIALKSQPQWQVNIENNNKGVAVMGKAMTKLKKMNLYELFYLHAIARGELVTEKEEADVIFSEDQGITPYDIEVIMADFMA